MCHIIGRCGLSFHIESNVIFAFYKPQDDEEVIEVKKNIVDLTPVIFQEIMLEVPMRVVKEGASLKTQGHGWKVLSEEDENMMRIILILV